MKQKECSLRAFHVAVMIGLFIFLAWPIKPSNSPETNNALWALIFSVGMLGLLSLTIAIVGYFNLFNISKFIIARRRKKRKSRKMVIANRQFDKL